STAPQAKFPPPPCGSKLRKFSKSASKAALGAALRPPPVLGGLPGVTRPAEWLQILRVEPFTSPAERDDVIDLSRQPHAAQIETSHTARLRREDCRSEPMPRGIVPPRGRRASPAVVLAIRVG